ncbi:MAG: DUF3109 family protein [Bacteroidetes bacterium]|nr:DUF3109 family protein [Bacteroidota bacterium]
MIGINEYLISDSVMTSKFACDLKKCKGACCVEGLAGPPVSADEIEVIKELYPKIKHLLRPEGIAIIEEKGVSEKWEGTDVLTCVNEKECVFVVFDDGIAFCGIEKAFYQGLTDFKKPVSCHLFPIRVRDFFGQKALNVVESDDCRPAFLQGRREDIPVHQFLKEAIIRRFGKEFYEGLDDEISKRRALKSKKRSSSTK